MNRKAFFFIIKGFRTIVLMIKIIKLRLRNLDNQYRKAVKTFQIEFCVLSKHAVKI